MGRFLRTTWLLYRTHLLRTAKARRIWLVAVGAALAPLIALVIEQSPRQTKALDVLTALGFFVTINLMAPLASVIVGAAVLGEEIEDRTITYLLTRPISRPAILIGRWLASVTVLVALFVASTAALVWITQSYPVRESSSDGIPAGLGTALIVGSGLAVTAYSALFATIGVFFKHPMIIGLAYSFVIEGFLANLPGKNQSLTLQYYVRSFVAHDFPDAWKRLEGALPANTLAPAEAARWLIGVTLAALLIGAIALRRRQFELTS